MKKKIVIFIWIVCLLLICWIVYKKYNSNLKQINKNPGNFWNIKEWNKEVLTSEANWK